MKPVRNRRRQERPRISLRATGAKLFAMGFLSAAVALLLVGSLAVYRYVSRQGYLRVNEIAVYGTDRVGSELADYLRLDPRVPLTELDGELLEVRMERHPWVRAAVVEKGFPGKLEIRIEERTAVLLHLSEGRLWIVDDQGAWVKPLESEDLDLPVVTNVSPEPVTEAVAILSGLADFARYWDSASSPARPGEIRFVSAEEVQVYPLGGGPRLHLPLDKRQWDEVSRRIRRIQKESSRVGLQLRSIDLLFPDRAIAERET